MAIRQEFEYSGNWIEVTEKESDGLFLANIRITPHGPASSQRKWTRVDTEIAVYFDFETACAEALEQARKHIDKERDGLREPG